MDLALGDGCVCVVHLIRLMVRQTKARSLDIVTIAEGSTACGIWGSFDVLHDGYTDVPDGKVIAVVTHLEMRAAPRLSETAGDAGVVLAGVVLRPVPKPSLDWYRDLYFRVGADWLWTFRLVLPDDQLAARVHDPKVVIFALERAGVAVGLLELDFRIKGACELALFGVVAGEIGRGFGRMMMQQAIKSAWSRPISRFWVHTCTLDHPGALGFYIRSGFTAVRRQIEVLDDPRLTGLLPMTAAPQVPVIKGPAAV